MTNEIETNEFNKLYNKVQEEFEIVAKLNAKADVKSAMMNVDNLVKFQTEKIQNLKDWLSKQIENCKADKLFSQHNLEDYHNAFIKQTVYEECLNQLEHAGTES